MTFLREINTNSQFPFRFTFKRTENVLSAVQKKRNEKFEKRKSRVAFIPQDGGLASTFCRKKTVPR